MALARPVVASLHRFAPAGAAIPSLQGAKGRPVSFGNKPTTSIRGPPRTRFLDGYRAPFAARKSNGGCGSEERRSLQGALPSSSKPSARYKCLNLERFLTRNGALGQV